MTRRPMTITTRRWRREDIPEIIECSRAAYGDYPEEYVYTPRQYEMQFAAFPQGQFVALCGKRIVGYATSLIVNIDDEFWYDVDELTGAGTFSTHNPGWGHTLRGRHRRPSRFPAVRRGHSSLQAQKEPRQTE